jgi:hypothetical protein
MEWMAFVSMNAVRSTTANDAVTIEVGGISIALRIPDGGFRKQIENRYEGFVGAATPDFEFDVDLVEPSDAAVISQELRVGIEDGEWWLERGDFCARWSAQSCRGRIRQTRNRYAVDAVLRILHTLLLAQQGGFLVHAASAIRSGKAFIFSGISGAGKTTMCRLAPPDATLLSDEISYVRRHHQVYIASGTPFSGELARAGENRSAPVAGFFLLEKGATNKIEAMSPGEAVPRLLRNILFFSHDTSLVKYVFQSACEFASSVPVRRLTFVPDRSVWELIR